jgi:hypothetical protein
MFARTLLTGLLAAAAMVSGSAIPASTLHKRDVTTVYQCKVPGQVALTFDGMFSFVLNCSEAIIDKLLRWPIHSSTKVEGDFRPKQGHVLPEREELGLHLRPRG